MAKQVKGARANKQNDSFGVVNNSNLYKNESNKKSFANGGIYWLKPNILSYFTYTKTFISLEQDILFDAEKKNYNIIGIDFYDDFIDIGIPEDYLRAQTFIK